MPAVSRVAPSDARAGRLRGREPGPVVVVPPEQRGLGAPFFLLAIPVLCCAGPAVVATASVVGAATLGMVGGTLGVALTAVAMVVFLRRRHARCCTPAQRTG